MRTLLATTALLVTLSAPAARAQTPSEALATCLTDNTTGRDRKDLARWIFTALAAHPDMETLVGVTAAEREQVSQTAGALVTRLLAEDCLEEVRVAVVAEGGTVIETAFGVLGEVAMEELMRNELVSAAADSMANYIDMDRLEAAFSEE